MDNHLYAGATGNLRLPCIEELDFYANRRRNLVATGTPSDRICALFDECSYAISQPYVQMRGDGLVEQIDVTPVQRRISPSCVAPPEGASDTADRQAAKMIPVVN